MTPEPVNLARWRARFQRPLARDPEDAANDFIQLAHIGRFAHKSLGATFQSLALGLNVDAAAYHDDGDVAGEARGLEILENFETVAGGHVDIEQNQVGICPPREHHGLHPVVKGVGSNPRCLR